MLNGYAICKDCDTGTMNNRINIRFELDGEGVYCAACGSRHIDGELYLEGEDTDAALVEEFYTEQDADGGEEIADPLSDESFEREVGA